MRPPQELLYDSEASLRLVDNAIEELRESAGLLDTSGVDSDSDRHDVAALAEVAPIVGATSTDPVAATPPRTD